VSTITGARPPLPPLAARPVTGIALALPVVLLALGSQYGYHRDELYFRMLGEHPALGYFDTPPLTPLVARVSTSLFGDTVVALRIWPAVLSGLVVVLVALIARELGASRTGQILAAAGIATGVLTLILGHALLTAGTDMLLWVAVILCALRALLRGDSRWWLAVGVLAGAATYNRELIALFAISLGAGVLLAGPRSVLRDRYLWAGALIAAVIAAPNLFYQVTHHWPQFQMAAALRVDEGSGNRVSFLPLQMVLLGPPIAVIGVVGWVRLWRDRAVRCFAVAYFVACAFTLYSGGRPDYVGALLVLLFAAGCGPTVEWAQVRWRRVLVIAAMALNAVMSALLALPLVPASSLHETPIPGINEVARESVGWPRFVSQVGAVVRALPPEDRSHAVLLAQNYGEAGAEDLYAARYDLPRVYSGHNELYWWGAPPASATVAVVVTDSPPFYGTLFKECAPKGRIDNGVQLDNEEQGLQIVVCHDPIRPWTELWPQLRHYS
jgi:hypothetical protein